MIAAAGFYNNQGILTHRFWTLLSDYVPILLDDNVPYWQLNELKISFMNTKAKTIASH